MVSVRLPDEAIIAALPIAAERLRREREAPQTRAYWYDPKGWVHDRVRFEGDETGPASYQDDCLDAVGRYFRGSARGPHGLGKTSVSAWIILWFVDTREQAGVDWKVVTTAGSWGQLRNFLWPEVHKWARRIRGRRWREGSELLQMSIKLRTGQAFAVASNKPELIEGAHADQILYVYDEAKSIPPQTFDASEGAFSGAGRESGRDAFAWAGSTPGAPTGRFADIHHRKAGYEDWWARHVTLEEAIEAGRISREWAEQRRQQWGERSAVYINRVLGEFAPEDAQSVIPISWVEAAFDRWRLLDGQWGAFTNVGVDVARFGSDRTVLAPRFGDAIAELRVVEHQETTQTTGMVAGILSAHRRRGEAVVDVIGMGAGVVDQLREQGFAVVSFNASERSEHLDRSGELRFVNRRSAGWWNLREMLDPSFDPVVALPPDEELLGDLVTPTYRVTSGGAIVVESKDEIRKRLGRSTDKADAVVMAFALPEPTDYEGFVVYDEPVMIGGGF